MTTKITIKLDEPEGSGPCIRVASVLFDKDKAGAKEVQSLVLLPGQSADFYIHSLCDLRIHEVIDSAYDQRPAPVVPPAVIPTDDGVSGIPRHQRSALCLPIAISVQVDDFLEQLVVSGLFGNTRSEVAERLLCEKLREITEGNMSIANAVSTSLNSLFNKLIAANEPPTSPTMPSGPSNPSDCCPPGSKGF